MADEFEKTFPTGRPVYELGDQDYASAAGWDPGKEMRDKLHAESLKRRNPRFHSTKPDMFTVYRAGDLTQSDEGSPGVGQLFGPFWLHHEMAILFARTGIGKSLLATQIAESLALGRPIPPFDKFDGPSPGPQRVLYLDFELSREQFTVRYSVPDPKDGSVSVPYRFSPNFLRAEHLWNGQVQEGYRDFTDMLFTDLEQRIYSHDTEVLIVDNISFLTRSSTAHAAVAFRLMNCLQELKKLQWISILVLAHTPKRRPDLPLTDRDLQGSVDLAKVADSAFAMGLSRQSPDLRYLKHVKSRTGRIEHGSNNVAIYKLGKFDLGALMQPDADTVRADNYLGFDFEMFDHEEDHLEPRSNAPTPKRRKARHASYLVKRAQMLAADGVSSGAIAKQLGIGRTTVFRYLQQKVVTDECST